MNLMMKQKLRQKETTVDFRIKLKLLLLFVANKKNYDQQALITPES